MFPRNLNLMPVLMFGIGCNSMLGISDHRLAA